MKIAFVCPDNLSATLYCKGLVNNCGFVNAGIYVMEKNVLEYIGW